MASYEDRLKDRKKKYSDPKKENSQQEKKTPVGTINYDDRIAQRKKKYSDPEVDENYISAFLKDADNYMNSAHLLYKNMGWGNAGSTYDARHNLVSDLRKRSFAIEQFLDKNKDYLDPEQYSSFKDYLSNFGKTAASYDYAFYQKKNLYSDPRMDGYNTKDAKTGWEAYTAQKTKQQEQDEKEPWWKVAIGYLGNSPDTTLPGSGITQVVDNYRNDTSYREPTDQWEDHHRDAFGYLYAKNPEEAWKYAEDLNNQFALQEKNQQKKEVLDSATDGFWKGAGHTAGALLTAPLGLADYINDMAEYSARGTITEKDGGITPFEYSQTVTGGIAQNLNKKYGTVDDDVFLLGGKGWGDVYSLGTSIAQSSLAGYTGGQFGTLVQFFGTAAASGIDEAKSRGASDEQALAYGTLTGVAEGLAEMIGVDNLFKIGSATTMREAVMNIVKQGASEGLEEGITSVLNNFADQLVMGDKSNFNILVRDYVNNGWDEQEAKKQAWIDMAEDTAFDMLGGFASGSVHAGIQTGLQNYSDNRTYSSVYGESAMELVEQGLESAEGSLSHELAVKYQEKLSTGGTLSGAELNRLIKANEQQFLAEDKESIKQAAENRLVELGEFENATKVAEVLMKQATKQKLTRAEKQILAGSKYAQRVANEMNPANIESGKYSTAWAERIGTSRINDDAYNRALMDLAMESAGADASRTDPAGAKQENAPASDKVGTKKETASQSRYEVSESGETMRKSTGEAISIAEVASIKDGKMQLKLTDGRTVDAEDVSYGSQNDALVYEAVAKMGVNAAAANVLVNAYHPGSGVRASVYAHGIQEAYRYGQYNYPDVANGPFSSMLTEQQRNTAYKLGQMFSGKQVAKAQAIVRKPAVVAKTATTTGKVHFEGDRSRLTERQSASLTALETVADVMGVQIHVFESKLGEDGRRIGANGWYDPSDSSIHIDLHAGSTGEGTMLFTAAHELTHHVRKWSPAKFKTLSNFLMQEYGKKGVSVDVLVQKQIEKAKRTRGVDMSYDDAFEEVIADSMETMLSDGNVMEKIAKLKQQDRSLWQKIKDFISDLAKKIRQVYEGMTPDSEEGKYVAEMKDSIEKLEQMFAEALVEASENHQASEQVLGQAGIAVDSKTDAGSIYSVRDVLSDKERNKVAKALAERFSVTEAEAKEWLKAETSLASLILNPKYSMYLDYEGDPNELAIKQNSDYPQGTVDFSNICKKRREFTQVMNRILRNFPNHVFAATDLARIRTIMGEEGMTLPCGICYVEDRRQLDTIVAQDFINGLNLYREGSKTRPDGKAFNANQLKGPQLTDGDDYVPTIYELVSLEGRNSLKAKNPNMEAAWVKYNNARGMQSVRLLTNEAEYKRQILKYNKSTVKSKNDKGGLRIYSFSDMEMFHLIDIIQVITDSATVGLSLQGYTKVNEYARAVKDTGEKLNRSLIPKGDLGYHMENGKVVLDYDTVEGIDIYHEDFFDNKDNPNVGNITIGINDTQIRAAMVSDFVDQIIPFHTGQSEDVLGEKGIAAWENYKDFQTEKDLATGKTASHQINIYTEVFQAAEAEGNPIQNKRQFVEKFLQVCKENGLKPRFAQFLNTDANGDYVYTEGYHKFLVDFKTFAQTEVGEYLPQMPVKPIFDNDYITGLLEAYVKEQQAKDAEVAKQMPKVIERITNEIIKPEVKYSDRTEFADSYVKYSERVTDKETLDFLNKQETITTYKTMQLVDGKLYPPMAARTNGEYEDYSVLGAWEQATEHPELIRNGNKYKLDKGKGQGSIEAAYNPYMHSSNLVLNDQFSGAYTRDNLVTVECEVPVSELTSGYHAQYAKDSVGWHSWHTGTVAGSLRKAKGVERQVFLSRWIKPVRIVPDYEVASMYKDLLDGTDVAVPDNVVTPSLLRELKNAGVKIKESGRIKYSDRDFPSNAEDIAKEYFGTTKKWSETGWLLQDGTQLDFSGRHWERDPENEIDLGESYYSGKRNMEHYEIAEAFPELREFSRMEYRGDHLDGFMNRGNIRIVGKGIVAIEKIPTEVQFEKLRSYFRENIDRSIVVGIGRGGLNFMAGTSPSVVIEGIRDYFSRNRRNQSNLMRFHTMFSGRDTDSVSNRSLLANAFEGVAQNEIERNKIQEYKGKIGLINSEERKLQKLNERIKELSFAKGPKDTKKIRELQFEAQQTANRISTYDKQLLRLEASKPLQDVLTREKKMAYQRAERKGKEALEAYRERSAKAQRELLDRWQDSRKQGIENRHRTEMRHKIKGVVNELNEYLLKGSKDKRVMMPLKKAVAEALDAVNMDTVGAEERITKLEAELLKAKTPEKIQEISRKIDHIREMGDKMSNRLKSLKDAYREIAESDDPLIANAHDEVIEAKLESVIEKVGNTPLRDMNLEQLEEVYDMYRMVLTTIRNSNKAFKAAKSESISVLANRVMEEVDKVGGKRKYSPAAVEAVKKFGWNNLKPVYAFQHIGSDTFTEVFDHVREGEDVWALDVTEAREYYLERSKKYKYDSWNFDKRYAFKSASGMDFSLNLEQIMSLYAYSKRDQAADHLKRGGIVIDETTEITVKTKLGIPVKFNPTEATAYNISDETLAEIVGKLTDDQKGFVDEMQEYLSTVMGNKGNEVSLELYGIKLFKEKFYFPLKSASQFMAKAKEQQQGETKIKNSGFSKETVKKANNPIVLTPFMNVWTNHVNEMSMYHAFVLPMEDFYRVYNYRTPTSDTMATESVEMFIQNAYGKGATGYIDQLLKDLNGGARTDSRTGIINKGMGLFKKGAVFASLSVVVQQPSAIARAAAIVDTKYFIGPKVDHKRHKALWNEVKQYAPVAIIKEMGYFDTNMGKSTQDFILGKEYSGFQAKMKALVKDSNYRDEILSKAPALADELAWCSIWEAVKRETRAKNPGLQASSEEFLNMAGKRFTEVIAKTQVYDSVLARSANMRSKDTGMKMATAFMAEPTTSINMIADALLQGKRGNKKYARAAIGAVIASQILNSILVSFVYAGRDDDEDETYWEKYIGTLSGEIWDSLNPAGYIPFIKDIQSIVKGYDVERSDMAIISDLWNAWQNLSKDSVSTYRKVEGFVGSICQIFGLPVKNIMRDARGIYQTIMSFKSGQETTKAGIGYAVKGAITGEAVKDQQQLYEAYLSGDKTQIARVESRYKNQTAINTAIRKALRENDPRIAQAAQAKFNGDLDEYMRLAKAIIAEKHFSQDNVVAAINAEINALDKGETTTSAPKASGLFKAEDFAVAIAQGDQAMANAIMTDVIKTAQKNGKTQEEAEKSFRSSAKSELKELFLAGEISEDKAISALMTYCAAEEADAMADVQYWAFKQAYPDVHADDSWFDAYYEDVADSGMDIGVYMEYRNAVKEITGDGKKERRMAVIDSLPITAEQKDALYYAEGWAASKLYEAPWH